MFTFGHIGIPVADMKESLAFYTEILQCEVIKEYDYPEMTLVFLRAGNTNIELIHHKNKDFTKRESRGAIDHIALKVEQLDELMVLLRERNIEIIAEPKIVGKARVLFFSGPNGERFEFVERIAQ